MEFKVTILGSNSASPSYGRFPSSQLLTIQNHSFLIDCGEGTQFQLNRFRIKRNNINHIFISHLHGDHYFGLIGLITSFHLNNRKTPLYIYGPEGLQAILEIQLKFGSTTLSFPLIFHIVKPDQMELILENDIVTVQSVILSHRIPTTGFIFKEKITKRNIKREKISELKISYEEIVKIKEGADYIDEHRNLHKNHTLTYEPPPTRSYAYISDTIFLPELAGKLSGIDILYHEATFEDSLEDRAALTFHSTARQAAELAKKSNVKRLIIGHFSSRYSNDDLEILLNQAKEIFPETFLAIEGESFEVEKVRN